MRISVVIIVYNLEAFVGAAIDSVLAQTRAPDEIFVIDDCSTDRSLEIVSAYGDAVRVKRMPRNSGALFAALKGVEFASGDVVCLLDGDDVWARNKLEVVQREFAARPDLVLLSHHHVRTDPGLTPIADEDETHRNIARILRHFPTPEARSEAFRDTILAQRGYWLGSAYSFRRSAFDPARFRAQIGAVDPKELKGTYLDLVIAPYLVLTLPDGLIGYTSDTHFLYRLHGNASLSANATVDGALRSLAKGRAVNEAIAAVLRANGAPETYQQRRALLIEEYDYLADLYRGKTANALIRFVRLAVRLWPLRRSLKEALRVLACTLQGPGTFLRQKQARAHQA